MDRQVSFWPQKFIDFFLKLINSEIAVYAAHLAFYTILLIVPLITAAVSLFGNLGLAEGPLELWRHWLLELITYGLDEEMSERLTTALHQASGTTIGWAGATLSAYAVLTMITGVNTSVQMIWESKNQAGFLKSIALYIAFPVFLISGFFFWIVNALAQLAGELSDIPLIVGYINIFCFLSLLYIFVPNIKVRWWAGTGAAIMVTICFIGAQKLYLWASHDLFLYNEIYGSLAIFPLFLLWIYLVWLLFLLGVLFTRILQDIALKKSH